MSKKILVIDDNEEVRDMLHDLLKFKGYSVETAPTGVRAIEDLSKHSPDLIICDIAMPDKDGFQVLEEVRATPNHDKTPFIFLTASVIQSEEERIIRTSANGYLMKPYDSSKLFNMINNLLTKDDEQT